VTTGRTDDDPLLFIKARGVWHIHRMAGYYHCWGQVSETDIDNKAILHEPSDNGPRCEKCHVNFVVAKIGK